jgi:hypothetical protein
MRAIKGATPAADRTARERRQGSNIAIAAFASPDQQRQCTRDVIRAQLIGSDRSSANGLTARGTSPVLQLCRSLVAGGIDPDRPLHAYRGDTLCLVARSIGSAARLTVDERRTAFARWKPFCRAVGSPRIAASDQAATPTAGALP